MADKKKRRFPIPISAHLVDGGCARVVLRAHTIADTVRALHRAGVIEIMQADQRDAVAEELQIPALWLDAAQFEGMETPRVSLDLLEEYREWKDALPAPSGEA